MRILVSLLVSTVLLFCSSLAFSQQWITKGTCSLSSGACKATCDAAKKADPQPNDSGIARSNWGCSHASGGYWFGHTSGDMWQYVYVSNTPPTGPSPPPPSSCKVDYDGNPIRIATGEKYETEIDYQGRGNMPLQIRRSYHSRELGWHFSMASRLNFLSEGGHEFVQWITEDGFSVSFAMSNGVWISKSAPSIRLSQQDDQKWSLQDGGKNNYIFSDSGVLQNVSNNNGEVHTFIYGVTGRLTRIDSNSGDGLSFEYDASSNLTKIVNASDEVFEYVYLQDQIVEVKFPGGSSRIYHYEDSNFPAALTGITDENNIRYVTWAYDEEGRGILSEHLDGADRTEFVFHEDGSTTVTNPLEKTTTYHYVLINDEKKLTHIEGHISQNCAASSAYKSYYTDGTLQTSSDRNGNTTLYERDEWGREIRKVSGLRWSGSPQFGYNVDTSALENTALTKVEQYCWHPDFSQVVKAIRNDSITRIVLNQQGLATSSTIEPRTSSNESCD